MPRNQRVPKEELDVVMKRLSGKMTNEQVAEEVGVVKRHGLHWIASRLLRASDSKQIEIKLK